MRVCILHCLSRIRLGEGLAGVLAVGVVLCVGVLVKVAGFVVDGSTARVGTLVGSFPECTTEVDHTPLIRVDVSKDILLIGTFSTVVSVCGKIVVVEVLEVLVDLGVTLLVELAEPCLVSLGVGLRHSLERLFREFPCDECTISDVFLLFSRATFELGTLPQARNRFGDGPTGNGELPSEDGPVGELRACLGVDGLRGVGGGIEEEEAVVGLDSVNACAYGREVVCSGQVMLKIQLLARLQNGEGFLVLMSDDILA